MMLVVSGTRSSSKTSSVMSQPLSPSDSKPSTEDTRRPVRSSSCSRAFETSSRTLGRRRRLRRPSSSPLSLSLSSAMSGPAFLGLAPAGAGDVQALEQVVLLVRPLLLGHLAVLDGHLQRGQLAEDPILVIELPIGLLGDLVGHPGRAPHRGQREREQSGDQPHAGCSSKRTNECGGSGPT